VQLIIKRELDRAAYRLPFHVRVPAHASSDLVERERNWGLGRMRTQLEKQGWTFVTLSPERPRGPFPVVPVKGVGKRPSKSKRVPGRASPPERPDDSLWRISTLPHLLTDEVEWEYIAVFQRPVIPTAAEAPEETHA
jgi:hypothetical protein